MKNIIDNFDLRLIELMRRLEIPMARIAIFVVYFWFGFLKIIGASPAGPLVQALFERTISFMSFGTFYILFAIFEMLIGILFLIKRFERLALFFLAAHLLTTVMPLILLPSFTWNGFFIPTLDGQYIIKNILITALAIVIGAGIIPLSAQKGAENGGK